jgi:putative transport protein
MEWLTGMLNKYPELAVYLALGVGYWVGSLKFGKFSLGGTTGSLLAGIAIGLLFKVPVSGMAKSVVFLLFLFGIGYEVGPRFFGVMKGSGWRYAVLGAFMPVVGLLTAWAVAKGLGLDLGFSAGMFSGGLTESPAMGTAAEAINALQLDAKLKETLVAHIGVADALTYVGGALGVILMCSTIGPWLLRIDLRAEALKLEAELGIKRTRAGVSSAWQPFEYRAYRVDPAARVAGGSVAEAEGLLPEARLFVQRLRRGGEIIDAQPETRIEAGDVVVVCGRREVVVQTLGEHAQEIDDRELLDIPVASFEIFVTAGQVVGRTLEVIGREDAVRGVFLRRLVRYGQDIPIGLKTVVERGDVMHVVGAETAVLRVARLLGEVVAPSEVTDFVAVGLAIFTGALLGAAASFSLGGVNVSIGTSVGTLLAGVVVGYARSVRPLFGRVPDGAVKLMQSFGLAGFVAMVGIGAGPHFVEGVRTAGLQVLLGGLVVTFVPLIAGLYFGCYVLKINPLLVLGAMAGAQTFTPGLAAVQEKSGSNIAVLGYSGAVPVGHILLTMGGTAIVLLLAG